MGQKPITLLFFRSSIYTFNKRIYKQFFRRSVSFHSQAVRSLPGRSNLLQAWILASPQMGLGAIFRCLRDLRLAHREDRGIRFRKPFSSVLQKRRD